MYKKKEGMARIPLNIPTPIKEKLQKKAEHEGVFLNTYLAPFLRAIANGEWEVKPERTKNLLG